MKTLIVALLALFALTSVAAAAPSRDCLSQAQAAKVSPGKYLKYREIGPVRCWFAGRTPDKSEFKIARGSAEPRATRAKPSGAQRVQAAPVERRRPDVEALGQYVPAAGTAKLEEKQTRLIQAVLERAAAADDLTGLEGTLCAGPCEDLRTIDPKELRARLEAAYAAFMEYWLSFSDRWALR
jgi:hypothetical protein